MIPHGDDHSIEPEFPLPFRDGVMVMDHGNVEVMNGQVDTEAGELERVLRIRRSLGPIASGTGSSGIVGMKHFDLIPAEPAKSRP
jgi:hypothetical protein